MNDIPLTLFSGGDIAATTILVTFFTWLANRTMAHQAQIKNLGDKIDHVEDKMDRGFKHLEDKIDSAIKHMDEKMNIQDKESKERISRLEKYFDIIMQTQIKKNSDQLSMEG